MRHKVLFLAPLLLINLNCFASSYYACPNSSQYVYPGDTIDQVLQACGKPDSETAGSSSGTKQVQELQWVYNYKQWTDSSTNLNGRGINRPYYQQNLLIVNFASNLVIHSLYVNNQSVQSTNFCNPNRPITVGQSTNLQVRQLCGQPSIIQMVTKTVPTNKEKIVVWTYQQPYMPTTTLTFEDSKLTSIDP